MNHPFSLAKQLKEREEKIRQFKKIDRAYIMKAYKSGFLLCFIYFFFVPYKWLAVASLILYPAARMIYDTVVGFWLDYYSQNLPSYYQARWIIHLIVHLFSFVLGPIGLLYFGGKAVYKKVREKGRNSQ